MMTLFNALLLALFGPLMLIACLPRAAKAVRVAVKANTGEAK